MLNKLVRGVQKYGVCVNVSKGTGFYLDTSVFLAIKHLLGSLEYLQLEHMYELPGDLVKIEIPIQEDWERV